ncbi:MAG: EI24 domain-containing protein [Burkholderiaceae bacterium]|nr:EI24 domain-containing protein [Burkholderiaceae bacterium]
MKLLIDSFWRAAAYCLHPRVIALSLLPLVLMGVVALGLGYFFWAPVVSGVAAALESYAWVASLLSWLESAGLSGLRKFLAPLIVVFAVMPLIVVGSLLVVAALMTPAMVSLVAERRFQALDRRHGGSAAAGAFAALLATFAALVALVISIPLWFVPPLVLILPPLIWGWLTYKVMTYDVLAEHATKEERRELVKRHRSSLLGMGILTGYLGAAPSLLWASGVLFLALAPVLVPVAIWIYTLVFAFSALWFSHFALSALQALRRERDLAAVPPEPTTPSPVTEADVSPGLIPLPPA